MDGQELLSLIWSQHEVSPIAQVLEALLQQRTIGLVVEGGLGEVTAMSESEELMPHVTLGDVLAEEMGIYLAKGTLVVFEPSHLSYAVEFSGHELGQILGRVLLDLAEKNCCPSLQSSGNKYELPANLKASSDGKPLSSKLATINLGASAKPIRRQASLAYLN
jgi:hypothetical protein